MKSSTTTKPKRAYKRRVPVEDPGRQLIASANANAQGIRVTSMVVWRSQLFLATDRGLLVQSDEFPDQFKPVEWSLHGTGEKIG